MDNNGNTALVALIVLFAFIFLFFFFIYTPHKTQWTENNTIIEEKVLPAPARDSNGLDIETEVDTNRDNEK